MYTSYTQNMVFMSSINNIIFGINIHMYIKCHVISEQILKHFKLFFQQHFNTKNAVKPYRNYTTTQKNLFGENIYMLFCYSIYIDI